MASMVLYFSDGSINIFRLIQRKRNGILFYGIINSVSMVSSVPASAGMTERGNGIFITQR